MIVQSSNFSGHYISTSLFLSEQLYDLFSDYGKSQPVGDAKKRHWAAAPVKSPNSD